MSFLRCYIGYRRITGKLFSVFIARGFAHFGRHSFIMYPLRIYGERRIYIGDRVTIGAGAWLQVPFGDVCTQNAIQIGDDCSLQESCVISAVQRVVLEESVLLARNVYISDHIHSYRKHELPILSQGVDKVRPVLIKRGAWLGQNVVVCPGVTIGRGAVVGANSVVIDDVPDFTVSVGAPARVVKSFSTTAS